MKRGLPEKTKVFEGARRTGDTDNHFITNILGTGKKQLKINVNNIVPNPNQPRKDMGDLSELVESIREKGIIEPIIVRRVGDEYQIIAGERRFRAFLESGREEKEIPCVVIQADDRQALEISLVENLQRKDLNIWEESEIFRRMSEELGYTINEISKRIGKSIGYVSEIRSISKLPQEAKEKLSKFENLSQNFVFQAVRAHKGGKLREYTEMLEEGYITSVKDAKKTVDRMVKVHPGRRLIWTEFKYGNYKLNKDKKGNFLITIKCKEEEFKNSLVQYLQGIK